MIGILDKTWSPVSSIPRKRASQVHLERCGAFLECTETSYEVGSKTRVALLPDNLIRVRARMDDKVKLNELPLIIVKWKELKRLHGLQFSHSGLCKGTGTSSAAWLVTGKRSPVNRKNLSHCKSSHVQRGKPGQLPASPGGYGKPQGNRMRGQAEDQRKSKGFTVMVEITIEHPIATISSPKGGPLLMGSRITIVEANLLTWERR